MAGTGQYGTEKSHAKAVGDARDSHPEGVRPSRSRHRRNLLLSNEGANLLQQLRAALRPRSDGGCTASCCANQECGPVGVQRLDWRGLQRVPPIARRRYRSRIGISGSTPSRHAGASSAGGTFQVKLRVLDLSDRNLAKCSWLRATTSHSEEK